MRKTTVEEVGSSRGFLWPMVFAVALAGAILSFVSAVSPWVLFLGGSAGVLTVLLLGARGYQERNGYWSYNLEKGYSAPKDYDIDEVNQRLGIEPRER